MDLEFEQRFEHWHRRYLLQQWGNVPGASLVFAQL